MLVHIVHGFVRDLAERLTVPGDWVSLSVLRGYATEIHDASHAPHRVCASAEPEQIDAVARFVHSKNVLVAVGGVSGESGPQAAIQDLADVRDRFEAG
jgi:hypothetical protein